MKKTRLALMFVLLLLCVGLVFSLTSCGEDENIYTKDDVNSLIAELEAALTEKATENKAAIASLKAEYTAKIAELEKANSDNKSAIATLNASYTAKVAELEAAEKANTDALAKLKADYEADLAELQKADADNTAAIESLTSAYESKVAELEANYKAELSELRSNYENEVAALNASISSNTEKISSLKATMENDINEINSKYDKKVADIESIIASLQGADTDNVKRIAALEAQMTELLSRHEHSFGAWIECDEVFEHDLSYRICTECQELEWRGLCRVHSFTTVTTPPTCTTQGYDTNTCSVCNAVTYTNYTPESHNYSTVFSFNASYHWYDCTTCGEVYGYEEHSVDENYICSVCNQPLQPTPGVVYLLSTDGTYAEVVDYTGTETNVMIAEEYNGAPVTTIGVQAFANKNISLAVIPQGVTTIREKAFSNCTNLSRIIIPNTVSSVESSAFNNCYSLKSVRITNIVNWCSIDFSSPSSNPLYYAKELYVGGELLTHITTLGTATAIKKYAFYGCTSLKSVDGLDGVGSIGSEAFRGCTELESITIPNSVTSIGDYAFSNCQSLEDLTVPGSVTTIGNGAFSSCSKLLNVFIEEGLTTLGNNVFSDCTTLRSINIPDSITHISSSAFSNCNNLILRENGVGYIDKWIVSFDNTVAIPAIKSDTVGVADSAFKGATKIRSITIPASVKYIGTGAFQNCSNLTSIIFDEGSNVITIPEAVFYGCSALEHMTLPFVGGEKNATEASAQTLFGYIFGKTSYSNSVPAGSNDVTYYIPSNLTSVTVLGGKLLSGAFSGCGGLQNLFINSETIEQAFSGCKLTEVIIGDQTVNIVGAFIDSSIDTLVIGSGVTNIVEGSFFLSAIKNITVSDKNTFYKTIDGDLYSADEKTLHLLCVGKDKYLIPETVTTIALGALAGFVGNGTVDNDGIPVFTSTIEFEVTTGWTLYYLDIFGDGNYQEEVVDDISKIGVDAYVRLIFSKLERS